MNLKQCDLGLVPSKLTQVLCFKVPLEQDKLIKNLLRAEKEYDRTRLLRQSKLKRHHDEVLQQQKKFGKMEKKLEVANSFCEIPKLAHCERHFKILFPSADLHFICLVMKRAKKILETEKTNLF
ncbi:hypothetical protein JTE90_009773 [Oedothorax gibbosus]|uniref:Uncharacterized protein n=1 Tax=Oedothorax gibbosus TaxID=931172 RepID=A0AAV6V9A4_9ARAC|nr:hypothetical protein JTE90_009773 [Oedothorax gibbosus]